MSAPQVATSATETAVELTPQQDAAIHRRGVSIGLSAGAGCGKTFVLTQRFLTLLEARDPQLRAENHNPLAGIVAITFTDRAAREMRDRIRAACHERLTTCPPEEVAHWLPIIRALDSARISTIHSFCASLLRSHAIEAGLDPQVGLLDGATSGAYLRKVIDDTVFELLETGDADCAELVYFYGLERTASLLRVLLYGRFRFEFNAFADHTPETLAAKWLNIWKNEFEPQLVQNFVAQHCTQRLLDLLREHTPDHPVMQGRCEFLLQNIERLSDADDRLLVLSELRNEARVQGGGSKAVWSSEDVYKNVQAALSDFRAAIDKLAKNLDFNGADVQLAASLALTALHVLRELSSRYEQQKRRDGLLDFDDLLLRTRDLLRQSESVRQRTAASIHYLMVDEFQDTDPVQAEIVKQLCGDRLLDGRLFFVGDAKQSIYRFRRADPTVFTKLREALRPEGRLPLSTNFRSQPDVLRFVNCIFAPEMGEAYERLSPHDAKQLSPTPAIEFLFATPGADEQMPQTCLPSREGQGESQSVENSTADDNDEPAAEKVAQKRRREADWIARRIAALLNDNVPRIRCKNPHTGAVELRTARPGDVAIVFRALTSVWLYEEALRNYGIPYYLVGGRSFYAQQEVFDLVNLCSFLDDCEDQVSLAGVLRSPFFSISDDTLFAMVDRHGTLADALNNSPPSFLSEQQQSQWKQAGRVLAELRAQTNKMPLAALLNLAIARTGYDASLLAEFLGRRKLANLRKLIDMARQLDRAGLETIKDFVIRIRDSVVEQTDEELAAVHAESSDVVRLMSIHQAKGLEFPIVIVADVDATRRGGGDVAYLHPALGPLLPLPKVRGKSVSNLGVKMHRLEEEPEDAAELTRLFYVATTRAADYLILSAGLDADRRTHSPWMKLLANRFDLLTGLPAGDPYLGRLAFGEIAAEDIPAIRVHRQPPEIPSKIKLEKTYELPLEKWHESVDLAQPDALPETLRIIAPDYASRRVFSVSAIEKAASAMDVSKNALGEFPSPPAGEGQGGGASGNRQRDQLMRSHIQRGPIGDTDEPETDATRVGTIVHEILESIDLERPTSVDASIEQRLRAADAIADEVLRSAVKRRVDCFVAAPIFRELREATRCEREMEFVLRWPIEVAEKARGRASGESKAITITGKIDCLYQSHDGRWKIVDYKTGRISASHAAAVVEKYDVQLAIYAFAVKAAIGRMPDAAEILLVGDEITSISLDLSEAFLDATSRKIDDAIQSLRRGQFSSVSETAAVLD